MHFILNKLKSKEMTKKIEDSLKPKMEGKVYAQVWVTPMFTYSTLTVLNDLYTVKDGEVFYISKKGELQKSNDTLFNIETDCILIGNYSDETDYCSTSKEIEYKELIKTLKLEKTIETETKCNSCHKNECQSLHVCPLKDELNDDDKTLCDCCEDCATECYESR